MSGQKISYETILEVMESSQFAFDGEKWTYSGGEDGVIGQILLCRGKGHGSVSHFFYWEKMQRTDSSHCIVTFSDRIVLYRSYCGREVSHIVLNPDYPLTMLSDTLGEFFARPYDMGVWDTLFDASGLAGALQKRYEKQLPACIGDEDEKDAFGALFVEICLFRIRCDAQDVACNSLQAGMFLQVACEGRSFSLGSIELLFELSDTLAWYGVALDTYGASALYESLITSSARKRRGAYYTPAVLAREMTSDAFSLYFSDASEKGIPLCEAFCSLRVADPSCGGGHFLFAAFESSLFWAWHISSQTIGGVSGSGAGDLFRLACEFAKKCLYGVDIDARAVRVAQHCLHTLFCTYFPEETNGGRCGCCKFNVFCGNSLIGAREPVEGVRLTGQHGAAARNAYDAYVASHAGEKDIGQYLPYHWPIECGEVMARGGFSMIIGNPPYGKLKNSTMGRSEKIRLSKVYKKLYPSNCGNIEYYSLFIMRSLSLLSEGGILTYVLPNTFWGDGSNRMLRKSLFEGRMVSLARYSIRESQRLFRGSINYEVSVFLFSKSKTDIINGSFRLLSRAETHQSSMEMPIRIVCGDVPYCRVPAFSDMEGEYPIYSFLRNFDRFGEVCRGDGHIFVGKLDETMHASFLSTDPTGDLAIASNHIKDWYVDTTDAHTKKRWVRSREEFVSKRLNKKIRGASTLRELMDISPKLIGRQMANRAERKKLHFTLHYGNEVLTNGVRVIIPSEQYASCMPQLLALLNSSVHNWYFSLFSHTYNVKPYEIESLPLPSKEVLAHIDEKMVSYAMALEWSRRHGAACDAHSQRFLHILDLGISEIFFWDRLVADGVVSAHDECLLCAAAGILESVGGVKDVLTSLDSPSGHTVVEAVLGSCEALFCSPDVIRRTQDLSVHPWILAVSG